MRVHLKNVLKPCMSAWVNQRRSKILPPSAQILIVIGKAFAMHVNAGSSNHDPNHVLGDRDPKRLSERDFSPCEHSQSNEIAFVNTSAVRMSLIVPHPHTKQLSITCNFVYSLCTFV